jgi:threonylcarbamoyladenosine tRNA methylthiotransferase MtaB
VAVYTLGCKVNQFESDCLLERFRAQGFEVVPFKQEADLYLINTCSVTHEASRQSAQMVRRAAGKHPGAIIVASGCAVQLFPQDFEKMAGLDVMAGNVQKLKVPFLISSLKKPSSPCRLLSSEPEPALEAQYPLPGHRTRALLRIQDGCNASCSYCLVPRARGRSRSLPLPEVIMGVEKLAAQGIKELILTGIHLGLYGEDLSPSGNLVSVLKVVLPKHPELYIRLSSLEPQEVTPELIALFKKYPNLCPHLHIPLQAGQDLLLEKMNRHYSTEFYRRLVQTIHREIPSAAIGADLIVGFPGENDMLFQKTLEFISDLPLSYLHIFPYSPRPGTPAADFPGPVPEKIKKDRIQIMRSLDREKREAFMRRCLGQTFPALILQPDKQKGWSKALTENYLNVSIPGTFQPNDRIRIRLKKIDLAKGLIGEVLV